MKRKNLFNRDVFVFEDRPLTIPAMFQETVEKYPHQEAIVLGNHRITYSMLADRVEILAAYFQHHYGLQKGSRVALLMENRIEFVEIFLACATLGLIVVPLNVRCSEEELMYMIDHADVEVICSKGGFESVLHKWQAKHPNRFVLVTIESSFSGDHDKYHLIFEKFRKMPALQKPNLSEEDPLYIIFTSGTTGNPKGAIACHVNVIHSVMSYERVLNMDGAVRTLIAVPLFHVTGLVGQLLFMLYIGGTCVLMNRYKTEVFLKLIEQEQITFLFNVPAIYILMMNHKSFQYTSLYSVEVIAYGGAPMSKETIERLMNSMPDISLHNAYGATETSSPASIMPKKEKNLSKLGSVGKPVPVAEMKVVDEMTGGTLEHGKIGELYIKGPMIIKGYWRNEEENEANFVEDYWKSGDMAMLDEDDYLYIMDRKKDMINRGGEKIFSAEVENILYEHPKILEVAVVGVPDEIFGEEVKAYIVPRENITLEETEVKEFLQSKIAKYKIPKYIELIESLPRNAGGKILKTQLVDVKR